MVIPFLYWILRRVLELLVALRRPDSANEIECSCCAGRCFSWPDGRLSMSPRGGADRALILRREVLSPATIAGAGAAALVIWSVLGDHGTWWIAGASVLAAIEEAAVRVTWVDEDRDRP